MKPFHLAYTIHDLEAARSFYGTLLGCREGRSTPTWVDYDFFGHQLSLHLGKEVGEVDTESQVDGHAVPMPHFGCLLDWEVFDGLAERLREAGAVFVMEPELRFPGRPGEQKTMFVRDPSGNALEFKAFKAAGDVFAS